MLYEVITGRTGQHVFEAAHTIAQAQLADLPDHLQFDDPINIQFTSGRVFPAISFRSAPIKMAVVFAILALLPSLLVMMTSFTRIVIV